MRNSDHPWVNADPPRIVSCSCGWSLGPAGNLRVANEWWWAHEERANTLSEQILALLNDYQPGSIPVMDEALRLARLTHQVTYQEVSR